VKDRSIVAAVLSVVILCGVLSSIRARAQELAIHPRVGNELDDGERRYFNLFRQWPSGTVTAVSDGRGAISFVLANSNEHRLVRPETVLVSLGTYLDRFEHLGPVVDSLDWAAMTGVVRYAKRYFPRRPYTFVSLTGRKQKAYVTYADDDDLWVSADRSFDWRRVEQSVLRVDESRIARITRRRHWLAIMVRSTIAAVVTVVPWRHSILNAGKYDFGRVVGAAGTAYAASRWALTPRRHSIAGQSWRFELARIRIDRKEAYPSDYLAPELRDRIKQPGPELFDDETGPPITWTPGWYVAVSSAWMGFPDDRSGYYATGFGLPDFEYATSDWTHIELGRDLDERFSLAVETRFALDPETGEPVMDYSGVLITALAEWHPWRPELHSFTRRFWISLGAGPTLARLVSGTVIEWTPLISNLEPSLEGRDEFALNATLGALQFRGRVSWAVTRRLALTARVSTWLPPFHLRGTGFSVGRVTYYELGDFSLAYGLSFGLVHRF
jgi:hypothetical protein